MQNTSSSSESATSLEAPDKDKIPDPADTGKLHASFSASMVALTLSGFRHFVKQQYPHWAEPVALVDAVQEALRQRYGGPCPEGFIWDKYTNNIPLRSVHEVDRDVEWKVDLSELSQEFRDFHPFQYSKGNPVDLSEALVSEKVSVLRTWLEVSREARSHSD